MRIVRVRSILFIQPEHDWRWLGSKRVTGSQPCDVRLHGPREHQAE